MRVALCECSLFRVYPDSKVGITLLHDCTLYHRQFMFGSLHFSGQSLGLYH